MVNNQKQFNEKYNDKEVKELEITRNRNFQGELIIENYSELEKLNLREVKSIEKIILKDLPNLKDCAIWKCNAKELIIENCLQIKNLNIRRNLLTNLEFIKDLENLETLEIDGNDKLSEILEPYEDDWKVYQKDLQESNKDINTLKLLENIQALKKENEFLSIKYDELKKFLKGILISFSEEKKEELSVELNKKINRKNSLTAPGMTKELMLNTKKVVKSLKEIKKELENELAGSKGELRSKREEIEWMRKEISTPKVQNIQHTVIGSQSINTYQIQHNLYYQQLQTDLEQQTSEILTNQEITSQDQQIINQTIIFLGTQELFVDYRQKLLNKLIDGYCQLAKKNKWTKWATFSSNLTGIGSKIAGAIPKGNIAQTSLGIIADTINLAANITQERNLEKYRQKLQEILTKDKEALTLFDNYYHPLEKTLWNNQSSLIATQIIKTLSLNREQSYPFSKGQNPFQGIWEKELTAFSSEQLKDFLKKLEGDLETFQKTFQQQRSELSQYEWFKTIEEKTDLLQEQPQNQIQVEPR
jgi:hypothetical protein